MAKKQINTDAATCGIVMPIAAMGDHYPAEHWRRVRKIIERSIRKAGLEPVLVWENAEVDVIQSAILQNLYENDVVVCDVSGLNPNVMLEAGLRLSTKRPTVIITDRVQRPPFDISNIGYIDYQRDLEYNAIEDFIDKLADKITDVHEAYGRGSYKSFVEQFKFETVSPETVSVPADEFLREQIAELASAIRRIEHRQFREPRERLAGARERKITISAKMDTEQARQCASAINDSVDFGFCSVDLSENGEFQFSIHVVNPSLSPLMARQSARKIIDEIIDEIPF
jgi:hypothetical protein